MASHSNAGVCVLLGVYMFVIMSAIYMKPTDFAQFLSNFKDTLAMMIKGTLFQTKDERHMHIWPILQGYSPLCQVLVLTTLNIAYI